MNHRPEPVVNASPFIILALSGHINLLQVLGPRVLIPDVVVAEVRRRNPPDAAVDALDTLTWLTTVSAPPIEANLLLDVAEQLASSNIGSAPPPVIRAGGRWTRLDPGESAVLSWAFSHPGTRAIIDDLRGRRAARALGIDVIGTLGIVIAAQTIGVITSAREVVKDIRDRTHWFIHPTLVERALAELER